MNNTIIILILLLFSNEMNEKSLSLNNYLKKYHNLEIETSKKYKFLCIITPSCSPCFKYSLNKAEVFLNKDTNNFVIFSGNLRKIPKELKSIKNERLLIDLENKYYDYDIFPFENVLLKVENNRIINVIKIEPGTKF